MNDAITADAYGRLIEPTTLRIERLLPGPIDRVWSFLTKSDLRRRWLASGDMTLEVGAPLTLVWQNDTLTDPPGTRPAGFGSTHSMESRITACEPPHKLGYAWGAGEVTFELESRDSGKVLLTVTHTRIVERSSRVMIGAGWHAHLDVLALRIAGADPATPFWDTWSALRVDYDRLLPA